jgi:hypothetical protein
VLEDQRENKSMNQALFLNGVFEEVLEEIVEAQYND